MRRVLQASALALALGALGCIPDRGAIPTIPIPPPAAMMFAIDDAAGTATLSFTLDPVIYAGDLVYIFNLTRSGVPPVTGGVVSATGDFMSEPFLGQREDQIDLLFREIDENGDDAFASLCLFLRDPPLMEVRDECPNQ